MLINHYFEKLKHIWARFWMLSAGFGKFGRLATQFASWTAPPYKGKKYLSYFNAVGYISPKASIYHSGLKFGKNVFIGDGVTIFDTGTGGTVWIGNKVSIHRDCIIETGQRGKLHIDENTHIQPRCQFSAYVGHIKIGKEVQIAPNCAFYPYDHSFSSADSVMKQPLKTKGGIVIKDDAWLGVGVIVLDGSKIGRGAVVGAGSVVKSVIPDYAIAVGNPARVVRYRNEGD